MTKLAANGKVTKDGAVLRLLPKIDYDPGGFNRAPVLDADGAVAGFTEEPQPFKLTAKGHLAKGEALEDFAFTDATVTFRLDTGLTYILRQAFTLTPPKFSGGSGEVEVEISGIGKPERA
jgi:hypothetical protein